jgi:hypothetical protein
VADIEAASHGQRRRHPFAETLAKPEPVMTIVTAKRTEAALRRDRR